MSDQAVLREVDNFKVDDSGQQLLMNPTEHNPRIQQEVVAGSYPSDGYIYNPKPAYMLIASLIILCCGFILHHGWLLFGVAYVILLLGFMMFRNYPHPKTQKFATACFWVFLSHVLFEIALVLSVIFVSGMVLIPLVVVGIVVGVVFAIIGIINQ